MTKKIELYSDGSSDGRSGGVGGYAWICIVDGVKVAEGSGFELNATNNVVEILAASKGLEYVAQTYSDCKDVTLISDSQLTLRWGDGVYKVKKSHLIPYVNALKEAIKKTNAKTRWVKGHRGNEYNEECDKLAKAARLGKGLTGIEESKVL